MTAANLTPIPIDTAAVTSGATEVTVDAPPGMEPSLSKVHAAEPAPASAQLPPGNAPEGGAAPQPEPNAPNHVEAGPARYSPAPGSKHRKECRQGKKQRKSKVAHEDRPASLPAEQGTLRTAQLESPPTELSYKSSADKSHEDGVLVPRTEPSSTPVLILKPFVVPPGTVVQDHVAAISAPGQTAANPPVLIEETKVSMKDSIASKSTEDVLSEIKKDKAGKVEQNKPSEQSTGPTGHRLRKAIGFCKVQKREVVMSVAFVLISVMCVTAVVLLLMWFQWNMVEVKVGSYGTVRGFSFRVEDREMYAFLGIYFGKPTGGRERFKRPERLSTVTRVVDASLKKPGCTQASLYLSQLRTIDKRETMEDCLHLNVWTPCLAARGRACQKTVVVFLFGTGFQNGDNNQYDGRYFSALGDVVLVVPNFRLGAFAFVSSRGSFDTPGNVALYDQLLAIQWALDHIQHFGGNSSNVVLMGSGSGAWSLGAHLLGADPFWRERFSRIILQGEAPFGRQYRGSVQNLGNALGCPKRSSTAVVECLRNASPTAIVDNTKSIRTRFGPTTDMEIITDDIEVLAHKHHIKNKQVLIGCVSNEGSAIVAHIMGLHEANRKRPFTSAEARAALDDLFGVLDMQNMSSLFDLYDHGRDGDIAWAYQIVSDILYVCPLLSFADHLAWRENRVYAYLFDHKTSPYRAIPGAPQLQDLDFLFGVPLHKTASSTEEERLLSRSMIAIWTNFAKTGQVPWVGSSLWPPYVTSTRQQVQITLNDMGIISNYRGHECSRIAELLKELQLNYTELIEESSTRLAMGNASTISGP